MREEKQTAAILMAVYNGEQFLREQLDSILAQSFRDWILYVSDDGSTDESLKILEEYRKKDARIAGIYQNEGPHGAFCNFYSLMRRIRESNQPPSYYFYCDQDDIWEPEKLEVSVKAMREAESTYGRIPLLCYSDLQMMDEAGHPAPETIAQGRRIELTNPLDIFFAHRYVWGTTMGHNRALWERLTLPEDLSDEISHDNYLAKYAAVYGKILYLDKPLVRYRRHGGNVSSIAKRYGIGDGLKRALTRMPEVVNNHAKTYYASLYALRHMPQKTELTEELEHTLSEGGIRALSFVRKHRIRYSGNLFNRIAFVWILGTGAYKKTHWFQEERKA